VILIEDEGKKMPKKETLEKKVFPGERIAVIEEYNKGLGTYQLDGDIRSTEVGKTTLDDERRELTVEKATPEILVPDKGMDVIAEVGSVARKDARIDIFILDGKHVFPTYSGVIHISDISRDYIKNIDSALKNGDIIKGKLVNVVNRLNQTSLEGTEYGVIYAYCSRCGGLLEQKQSKLICPDCGRIERRVLAKGYGKEEIA
jgi:exosome complex component CSL4